jgi:hypothetical protein
VSINRDLPDTDREVFARQLALVRGLSKAERVQRALALSVLVRRLAWEGASRRAGAQGAHAVKRRFLLQLLGPELTPELRHLADQL